MGIYMNEWEIADAVEDFDTPETPNLYRAAKTLERLKDWTNSCSDGWPYWGKPKQSAQRLMLMLLDSRRAPSEGWDVREQDLTKVFQPIKAFLTRHGEGKDVVFPSGGDCDLPVGYRWASAEEAEWYCARPKGVDAPNFLMVRRTVDSSGKPYTHGEADLAVRV